jgi:phosphoenolpyruvate-protein phosphotransferase (PTS system enzyme I)
MHLLSGIGAGNGIAIGAARLLPPRIAIEESRIATERIVSELKRFDAAITTTDAAMAEIAHHSSAPRNVGSDLVDTHRAMLNSDEIAGEARRLIRERSLGAEWAVRLVLNEMRSAFTQMKDERFRARFEDAEAVADRLLRSLLDLPEIRLDERLVGAIGIGFELSPLDALQLHRLGIAGFATERGGPTSHEAIIARTLDLPYVFGVTGLVDLVRSGDTTCVDGTHGEVVVNPDELTVRAFEQRRLHEAERWRAVEVIQAAPALTLDGTAVSMGANIESASEVASAIAAGADHIGLVRTELLYLDRRVLPSEEEQFQDAVDIVEAAGGRPVTFRTLDMGGDKLPVGVRIDVGPNPALGLRGIRFSLRRRDLFRTQLRALYRAAARGPLQIMFPLVSSATEIRDARRICLQVCAELLAEGAPHDPRAPIGAMIETPSAVLTADHIAAACDFMSVGTNDLIQYAFAADRQNEEMAYLYRPLHPSILRALQQVFAAAAAATSCSVSVCGDMAGDPAHAWVLLGLGLRSFSMTTRQIPFVKSVLLKTELALAEQFAKDALLLTDADDVEALVTARLGERFSLELEGHMGRRRAQSVNS